jgi:P27 family predicted phage terminase small subunit
MGQRGPLPMPDNVRALRGRTSHSKPIRGIQAVPVAPSPPLSLDREARAEWRRVAPPLVQQRVLSLQDRGILTTYCDVWSERVRQRKIARNPNKSDGEREAAQRAADTQTRLLIPLAKELTLTPSARLRTKAPDKLPSQDEDLD